MIAMCDIVGKVGFALMRVAADLNCVLMAVSVIQVVNMHIQPLSPQERQTNDRTQQQLCSSVCPSEVVHAAQFRRFPEGRAISVSTVGARCLRDSGPFEQLAGAECH